MSLSFTVPGIPQPQGSKRVVRGTLIEANAKDLQPWRAAVAAAAVEAMPRDWSPAGAFTVDAMFLFPWRRSAYNKHGQLREARQWDEKTTAPDLDKLLRSLLDALTGAGVWSDDSQVVRIEASKLYSARPGATVTVERNESTREGI